MKTIQVFVRGSDSAEYADEVKYWTFQQGCLRITTPDDDVYYFPMYNVTEIRVLREEEYED